MTYVPSKDSHQNAHSQSFVSAFVVRMKELCILGCWKYAQWRDWSDARKSEKLVLQIQSSIVWPRHYYSTICILRNTIPVRDIATVEYVQTKTLWPSVRHYRVHYAYSETLHVWSSERHRHSTVHITKTRLYNFDPLKPHFCIVKLGYTGVYIIFLVLLNRHRLWVLVRTASPRRF